MFLGRMSTTQGASVVITLEPRLEGESGCPMRNGYGRCRSR